MSSGLSDRLEAAIRAALPADAARVATAAKALSLSFTSEREALPSGYFDRPEALNAYAAAFLIPNAVKAAHTLRQAESLGLLPNRDRLSILDLGAGPGTASLAAAATLSELRPKAEVRITAIDKSGEALRLAASLFERIGTKQQSLVTGIGRAESATLPGVVAGTRFDIILAANLLNELPSEEAALELARRLIAERVAADGVLILLDPALRESARPLMRLRDRVLDEGVARVHAPCPHQGPCPMLSANERDWCHFYIDWERPGLIQEIDAAARMDRRHLKMSYLILSPPNANPESRVTDHELKWRAVSSPLVTKGKRELWLCGENGELRKVRRTDRDATAVNEDFGRAVRGDCVRCSATDRIRKEDAFVISAPWLRC